jgi:hypothetical protein
MNHLTRVLVIAVAALAVVATPDGAWARRNSGAHWSGARGGHPHHHRAFFYGGLFVGAPFWYSYYPPPYYYGPDYGNPQYTPPTVYVEKFEGTPTAETPGEIFCPEKGTYFPDVQDCSGGWQRLIRPQ